MSISTNLSRRTLLRALGGATAALPLLHARPGRAADPAFPLRLLVVTWPNGVYAPRFFPADGPLAIDATTPSIAPLAPFASKLLFVGGLEFKNQRDASSNNGHQSTPFVLTGKRGALYEGAWDGFKYTAGGPSIDQHIVQRLRARGTLTRFPSLVLGTHPKGGHLSMNGGPIGGKANAPTPEHDPVKLYETLFGDLLPGPDGMRRRAMNASVLRHVHRNVDRIAKTLGAEDRQKIEAHLDGIRELERQLADAGKACAAPAPPKPDENKNGTVHLVSTTISLLGKMVVSAFNCDLTRVALVNWGAPSFAFPAPGQIRAEDGTIAGPFFDEHGIAHKQWTNTEGGERRALVDRWFCERFAELLGALDAVKEAGGTMLDHTVVLFANQMADGYWHGISDLPWIVAGGGKFKTGRTVRHPSGDKKVRLPHVRLLNNICSAFDVPTDGFAEPDYGGELPGLRA